MSVLLLNPLTYLKTCFPHLQSITERTLKAVAGRSQSTRLIFTVHISKEYLQIQTSIKQNLKRILAFIKRQEMVHVRKCVCMVKLSTPTFQILSHLLAISCISNLLTLCTYNTEVNREPRLSKYKHVSQNEYNEFNKHILIHVMFHA